jgi:hypothetical protein
MRIAIALNDLSSWTLGLSRSKFTAVGEESGDVLEGDSIEIGLIFISIMFDWNLTIQ